MFEKGQKLGSDEVVELSVTSQRANFQNCVFVHKLETHVAVRKHRQRPIFCDI